MEFVGYIPDWRQPPAQWASLHAGQPVLTLYKKKYKYTVTNTNTGPPNTQIQNRNKNSLLSKWDCAQHTSVERKSAAVQRMHQVTAEEAFPRSSHFFSGIPYSSVPVKAMTLWHAFQKRGGQIVFNCLCGSSETGGHKILVLQNQWGRWNPWRDFLLALPIYGHICGLP